MRNTNQFRRYDWDGFQDGKDFTVVGTDVWQDYETKRPLGYKVNCVITRDDTVYVTKGDKQVSNLFQPITFKCPVQPNVKIGDIVVPVNPVVTVYGKFNENLSIKCDTVTVVTPKPRKD